MTVFCRSQLNGNNLRRLPRSMSLLTRLRTLDLCDNPLGVAKRTAGEQSSAHAPVDAASLADDPDADDDDVIEDEALPTASTQSKRARTNNSLESLTSLVALTTLLLSRCSLGTMVRVTIDVVFRFLDDACVLDR
jgi:Leucine-rich repeat (LRR) protein